MCASESSLEFGLYLARFIVSSLSSTLMSTVKEFFLLYIVSRPSTVKVHQRRSSLLCYANELANTAFCLISLADAQYKQILCYQYAITADVLLVFR